VISLKQIVVATDFCPVSTTALRHSLGIARRYHSAVSVVYVADATFYGSASLDTIGAESDRALLDAEQLKNELREEGLLHGLQVDFTVKVGSVWPKLAEAIDEKQPDLLVLGTRGRSGLRKLVLGSVAESAFKHAPCPVMTVGPQALQTTSSGKEAKHLLVPTDLSHASLKALPYGIYLARPSMGRVTLLHVLDRHSGGEQKEELLLEVKERLDFFVKQHADAADMIDCRVEVGSPAEVILKTAEACQSDLIVMGLNAWVADGSPMWRTAYQVAAEAPCPVLSMKAPVELQRPVTA
jgi:nucleotide-binding universal stress UspA family protein